MNHANIGIFLFPRKFESIAGKKKNLVSKIQHFCPKYRIIADFPSCFHFLTCHTLRSGNTTYKEI